MNCHKQTYQSHKKGPDKIGIFATHSPVCPNPIYTIGLFEAMYRTHMFNANAVTGWRDFC